MAEQTRAYSNLRQLSLYSSGWQDQLMQIGMWQKEKDHVTVTAFWVLASSLQSKQESGFCGNKPSIASSNYMVFLSYDKELLPAGQVLGEKHICHVQAAGARLTGNISGSICPWTDPLRDLTLPSLHLFPTLKEAFSHGSGLCIPTAVMSTLSIPSPYCCWRTWPSKHVLQILFFLQIEHPAFPAIALWTTTVLSRYSFSLMLH